MDNEWKQGERDGHVRGWKGLGHTREEEEDKCKKVFLAERGWEKKEEGEEELIEERSWESKK